MSEHAAFTPVANLSPATEPVNHTPWARYALQAGAAGIIAAEVTPANEAIRLGITGAVEAAASNPVFTTAAASGSTFLIEASAAVVTAALVNTEQGQKLTKWVGHKAAKVKFGKEGVQTGPLADLATGTLFGSAVATFSKQVQDPSRTKADNIRFGLVNAAETSAVVAVPAYLTSEGIQTYGPAKVGLGVLAVAGVASAVWAARSAKRAHDRRKLANTVSEQPTVEAIAEAASVVHERDAVQEIRYDLTEEQIAASETKLVAEVRQKHGNKVAAVWLSSRSEHANTVRTLEGQIFPEMPELMAEHEDTSAFLAIVDARKGAERIIRGTRLSSPMFREHPGAADSHTDTAFIQGMVDSGQLSVEDINQYAKQAGIDLGHTMSVESNFRVGERAKRRWGMIPMSQMAYIAMVKYGLKRVPEDANPVILAHVNDASLSSFKRAGIEHTSFAGRDDLHTPSTQGKFDDHYRPVTIPYSKANRKTFGRMLRLALPEIQL